MSDRSKKLQESLHHMLEDELHLIDRIYERLFEKHPETAELFSKHSAPGRQQMVRETLMYAIDHADGAAWVHTNVQSHGRKHDTYDVEPRMYEWYMECVLEVFAEVSGENWTPETAELWREAIGYLSDLMRNASAMQAAGAAMA